MLKQLFEKIFGAKPQPVVEAPAPAVVVVETNTYTVPVTAPPSTVVIPEVVVETPTPAAVVPAKKPAPKKKESWEFADKKAPAKTVAKPAAPRGRRPAKPAAPKRSKPQA